MGNIKKLKRGRIYWGIDTETGELHSIEDVASGLSCNSICPYCHTRLIARKGEKRSHHFAHETKYDCVFGPAVAVYQAVFKAIQKHRKLYLPDAVLKFDSYKEDELIASAKVLDITDVTYACEDKQFPPTLLVYKDSFQLQIILNFNLFYEASDIEALKSHAYEKNISILMIDIDLDESTITDQMISRIIFSPQIYREWIRNKAVDKAYEKYYKVALPAVEFESGYLCPAQKNMYKNVYSSRLVDCLYCEYCFSCENLEGSKILCLASSRINHYVDFKKTLQQREADFRKENKIVPLKTASDYKCPQCGSHLRRINSKKGPFAGCPNWPECTVAYWLEPTTGQVIIPYRKLSSKKW